MTGIAPTNSTGSPCYPGRTITTVRESLGLESFTRGRKIPKLATNRRLHFLTVSQNLGVTAVTAHIGAVSGPPQRPQQCLITTSDTNQRAVLPLAGSLSSTDLVCFVSPKILPTSMTPSSPGEAYLRDSYQRIATAEPGGLDVAYLPAFPKDCHTPAQEQSCTTYAPVTSRAAPGCRVVGLHHSQRQDH